MTQGLQVKLESRGYCKCRQAEKKCLTQVGMHHLPPCERKGVEMSRAWRKGQSPCPKSGPACFYGRSLSCIGKASSYGRYGDDSTVRGFIATSAFAVRVCGDMRCPCQPYLCPSAVGVLVQPRAWSCGPCLARSVGWCRWWQESHLGRPITRKTFYFCFSILTGAYVVLWGVLPPGMFEALTNLAQHRGCPCSA